MLVRVGWAQVAEATDGVPAILGGVTGGPTRRGLAGGAAAATAGRRLRDSALGVCECLHDRPQSRTPEASLHLGRFLTFDTRLHGLRRPVQRDDASGEVAPLHVGPPGPTIRSAISLAPADWIDSAR